MLKRQAEEAAKAAEAETFDDDRAGDSWEDFKRRRGGGRDYHGEEDAPRWREEEEYRSARRYKPRVEPKRRSSKRRRSSRSDSVGEALVKQVVRTAGSQITRSIVRGVLGGLFRGR